MQIPELSKEKYTETLSNARDDVKKAYELRKIYGKCFEINKY